MNYKKQIITPYLKVRPSFDTGDEILCSGKGLASFLVKFRTGCDISHVGKIVALGLTVFLWHSTSLTKGKSGPQLVEFRQWLKQYNGLVWWRKLHFNRTPKFRQIYSDAIEEFKDKEYERNPLELYGAASALLKNKENLKDIFCSEQNAEADKRTSVIITDLPSNEFLPKDSLPHEKKDKLLNPKASFGPIIRLK